MKPKNFKEMVAQIAIMQDPAYKLLIGRGRRIAMATSSIKEDLFVNNKDKIYEIAQALKRPKDTNICPTQPPKLSKDARMLWFKR